MAACAAVSSERRAHLSAIDDLLSWLRLRLRT
jgi:hypothetical protein